jgi:hypothetical protein
MGTGSIIFLQGLETINPVYNESIIEFYQSIISDATYATVTIAGANLLFTQLTFSFNFKQVAKVLINQNNFSDVIVPNIATSYSYDDTLSLQLQAAIVIYNSYTDVNVTLNYNFIKSVEQIRYRNKSIINNTTRILLPTTYIDYSIPWLPNGFAIYGLTSNTLKIKTLLTSPAPLQQPIQMLKFSLVMVVIMKQHQIYYHYLQHQFGGSMG